MEALQRIEQVLALGRKLVDELGMEPSVDTLGRWMAHHIAELIDAAANAPPESRTETQKRCFDAIFELWSHRSELPDGKRPFENLEPIIRAVESLDPNDVVPRYFQIVRDGIVEEDEESQTQSILKFVNDLDSTARILIGYALADAAHSAADKSREWVKLAENAGAELGAQGIVMRLVSRNAETEEISDSNECGRELLQDRVERLEAFTKVAVSVCEDLKARFEALPSSK